MLTRLLGSLCTLSEARVTSTLKAMRQGTPRFVTQVHPERAVNEDSVL